MHSLVGLMTAAALLVPAAAALSKSHEVKVVGGARLHGLGAELGQQVDRGMESTSSL